MPLTRAQVVDYLSTLSPSQLQDLILELEDRWGIERPATIEPDYSDYATMGLPAIPECRVVLVDAGPRRVAVMKVLRERSNLSVRDTKALVDGVPSVIAEALPRPVALEWQDQLVAAGASVELR